VAGPKRRSSGLVESTWEVESFHSWDKRSTTREPEEKGTVSSWSRENDVDGSELIIWPRVGAIQPPFEQPEDVLRGRDELATVSGTHEEEKKSS